MIDYIHKHFKPSGAINSLGYSKDMINLSLLSRCVFHECLPP
jgi:hypothetical protein